MTTIISFPLSKKISLLLILISLIFASSATSCQKAPINGKLDGQWQVMEVFPKPSLNLIDENLYYCFSLHVCQLTYYGGVFSSGNMLYDGEFLSLDFPYASSPTNRLILEQYGITENPVTFSVEHLDSKKLILRNGGTVVTLRKF